jgi:uncharacterized protein YkwD
MRLRPVLARISGVLVAAACATALLLPVSSAVAADTSQRAASQIQARWQQLKPVYSGSPYAVTPHWSAPYSAGALSAGFLQDGVNSINYARFLAGLPDDVTLDATNNDKAQHGAVLLAAGTFAHSQPKPADMDQAFFDMANAATSSSNIGWGYGDLANFNFGCVDDGDTGNIDRVGHRRWILNPPLLKTGMGFANARSDTYVFDWSRVSAVSYDSIKWPCAGPFPAEMIDASVPWSVTLNPSLYSYAAGTAGHTVTLRRARDGKVWTFTSADTNKSGEYFNFETGGYGVANCFIFRPDPASVGSYAVGDVFDVTISGGITRKADGSPATVSYSTQFISHNDQTPSADQTSGALAGVVSAGGVPLAGASVMLGSMGAVTTGADGSYQVPNVQPGTYAVVFWKPGYLSQTVYSVSIAQEATSTLNAALVFRPTIARSPSASGLTYRRRRGVARWTLSATFSGVGGARLAGQRVYLQISKNGRTGWKNVCWLTTNSSGRVSRALSARRRSAAYYRWYVGATVASASTATGAQKVTVK